MSKPQFLVDLEKDGFVVVPEVVKPSKCETFRKRALDWLESFPYGFKRDDRRTWTDEHLPFSRTGGLYNRYSVNHEDFVWDVRTDGEILKVFSEIWGTDDLIASFDGMNASLPVNPDTGRTDIKATSPWPHIDADARRVNIFELYQGIANLAPNGPDDGGLVVMSGSHLMHQQFFDETGGMKVEQDAGVGNNGYNLTMSDLEWYRSHGCKEVKICAGEGDLILWDSRTIHWNASPVGSQTRFVTYVCYCPRSLASQEDLDRKLDVFRSRKGTTHWPNRNVIPAEKPNYHYALPRRPDDSVDPANRIRPLCEPVETTMVMRLVGVR